MNPNTVWPEFSTRSRVSKVSSEVKIAEDSTHQLNCMIHTHDFNDFIFTYKCYCKTENQNFYSFFECEFNVAGFEVSVDYTFLMNYRDLLPYVD